MPEWIPEWLVAVFGLVGFLAAVLGLYRGVMWTVDRHAANLIVQCWWELTLDPVQRKRFRKSLSVGVREPDFKSSRWQPYRHYLGLAARPLPRERSSRWQANLVEPAQPLTLPHADADGAWALRLLIFNRSSQLVEPEDVRQIRVVVPVQRGVQVMSWQADDGRLIYDRTDDAQESTVAYTIHLPVALRSDRKIRDELTVVFSSRLVRQHPEAWVEIEASVKSKVKLYRPTTSLLQAVERYSARFLWIVAKSLGIRKP